METVGLAGLGFWIFLAAIIVAGIWFDARKREADQETLRRMVESGKPLDDDLIKRIFAANERNDRADHDLKVAGIIAMFVSPGLMILGWFLGRVNEDIFMIMIGVGLLVLLVGVGLYTAGLMSARWRQQD